MWIIEQFGIVHRSFCNVSIVNVWKPKEYGELKFVNKTQVCLCDVSGMYMIHVYDKVLKELFDDMLTP